MSVPSSDGTAGCTVGMVHIVGGILFFKNRDLAGKYVANRVAAFQSTPDVHLLGGVDLHTGESQGVSIGVNRHRVCVANTHVVSTPDVPYDLLCERLVHEVRREDDVPGIVARFVERHPLQGGRILVASPEWAFLVEVLGGRYEIEPLEGDIVVTNTFSLLSCDEEPSERQESSIVRLRVARQMLGHVSGLGALKAMLRSHVPEKGELSICNHRADGGGTESSHIIQIQGESVAWSWLAGFPCENDYQMVELFEG